jgi:hypothetical protein
LRGIAITKYGFQSYRARSRDRASDRVICASDRVSAFFLFNSPQYETAVVRACHLREKSLSPCLGRESSEVDQSSRHGGYRKRRDGRCPESARKSPSLFVISSEVHDTDASLQG